MRIVFWATFATYVRLTSLHVGPASRLALTEALQPRDQARGPCSLKKWSRQGNVFGSRHGILVGSSCCCSMRRASNLHPCSAPQSFRAGSSQKPADQNEANCIWTASMHNSLRSRLRASKMQGRATRLGLVLQQAVDRSKPFGHTTTAARGHGRRRHRRCLARALVLVAFALQAAFQTRLGSEESCLATV